jgi:hypothetical protein
MTNRDGTGKGWWYWAWLAVLCLAVVVSAVAITAAWSSWRGTAGPGQGTVPPGLRLSEPLTPSGWAPVMIGTAQISVPRTWLLNASGQMGCAGPRSIVFAGGSPRQWAALMKKVHCPMPGNSAMITLDSGSVPRHGPEPAIAAINGIQVAGGMSGRGGLSYLAPELHVRVTAHGPLARKIVGTLTRSPLAVMLERGPLLPVPGNWRWYEFAGVRFAAPGAWPLHRDDAWGDGCSPVVPRRLVFVRTARVPDVPGCGSDYDTAGQAAATLGVVAGSGPEAIVPRLGGGSRCRRLHGLRVCIPDPDTISQRVTLTVWVPRRRPVIVEIGLAGNGVIPRTIFDSIRPASL